MTTILIVEDDLINFRVFSKILTKRGGFEVQGTEDLEEVLRMAQAREVDIILMDVSLSHSIYQGKAVDGLAITKMLKDNPQPASMPVILVTAHAMEGGLRYRAWKNSSKQVVPMVIFPSPWSIMNFLFIRSGKCYQNNNHAW